MKKNAMIVNKGAKMISYFIAFFIFAVLVAFVTSMFFSISKSNVAIIPIHSEIGMPESSIYSLTSDSIDRLLESAEENPNVKVIVLSINSGGGSVVACQEIVEKVKSLEKPVIAWIRDIGASGAYWIASASDYIIASPISLTGSIGVTASYLDFAGLFEKYGITYWNFTIPENKDIFTSYKTPSEEEISIIESILNKTYAIFVEDVAVNRNMSVEYLVNVTRKGAVLSGEQAYEVGLVDYLGNREAMIALAKKIGNLTYSDPEFYRVDLLEKATSLFFGANKLTIKA